MLLALVGVRAFSQECDIPLSVVIPEQAETLDATSESQIKNKLRHITTFHGIGGNESVSRFAITTSVDVLNKEILSSTPIKYTYVLNVNLFIVDMLDQKIYSSTSVEVRSVGNSQTKAYVNGIRQLSPSNKEIQAFVETGKKKMLDYYDRNYRYIIKKAKEKAALRNYEEALFYLVSIPECCVGYDASMEELKLVYRQFVNQKCVENLAQAQAAWMSGFTSENAAVASVFLSEIYPDAACYGDAQALVDEIKKHMGKEWDFKLKRWDDGVRIELQRMRYAREIALAFAQNQPKETINFIFR
ncbi:hypothetical protein [uncultured Parabacteroides sp.]|uniref:hypothetical protein n=1 Tax=uncultured Parabacteroides sp. TaxID=512312 RepID=UPI002624B9E6|nr:hypothetical protein [uncultured Parabacteroides sp.]